VSLLLELNLSHIIRDRTGRPCLWIFLGSQLQPQLPSLNKTKFTMPGGVEVI